MNIHNTAYNLDEKKIYKMRINSDFVKITKWVTCDSIDENPI